MKSIITQSEVFLEQEYFDDKSTSLKDIIIDGLNIRFLLKDVDSRELRVTTISDKERDGYHERELLFEDQNVGTFFVTLLIPHEERDSYFAILGLPGHGTWNQDFIENYHAGDLARAGFIVIIPFMRAMMDWESDHAVSKHLLCNGFTLMGLRVYESLLTLKYLKYLEEVDSNKIGILAHSGGAAIANLLIYVTDDFKALLRDYNSNYLDIILEKLHCETIPSIFPFYMLINSKESTPIAILETPYGFKVNREDIIVFFNQHL
ncbi:MAG: hypothetical protein P9L98_02765 [Candidatus Kaelpia imicola]|nr:hypothetical protein [Candidatus Kaelpia imicola]